MKLFIISLCLLPLSSSAVEYLENDGTKAPEAIDRAIEENQQGEMQKEEEGLTTDFDAKEAKEEVTPPADAQEIQKEEDEKVEDNYLIGPYDKKGKMTYPNKDQQDKKEKLREKLIE